MKIFAKSRAVVLGYLLFVFGALVLITGDKAAAANCSYTGTDYGVVTQTNFTVPSTGTYRIWSRIMPSDTAKTSYLLEINSNCYEVGKSASIPANQWTWVDYYGGNTANKVQLSLTAGTNYTVKMIGNVDGLGLDRIIASTDLTGTPTGTGDDFANPPNQLPTIGLSASPTSGTAPLNATLTATPADTDGTVARVDFFRSGTNIGSKTSAPWTLPLTGLAQGTYSYTARVTDNDGGTKDSSAVTITVSAAAPRLGDTDNSGTVTMTDLLAVINNWNLTGRTRAQGDLTGDGSVTISDLLQVINNWTG